MPFFSSAGYDLAGFFLVKGISLVYFIAFLILYKQYTCLVGQNGLKPLDDEVRDLQDYFSIFHWLPYDKMINSSALAGMFISACIFLGLIDSSGSIFSIFCWFVMWVLFNSFLNSGGIFTEPGWERILSESGFLAIFLVNSSFATPFVLILLFRWVLFRMMLGSAIVKIRGGKEWLELSALDHFFESQPFPGPLSWHLHNLPSNVLETAALVTQILLLVIPFLYFAPQPYAAIGGAITIILQLAIFFSGNFAWLNIITVVLALSTFHDSIIAKILGISIEVSAYPVPDMLGLTALFFAGMSIIPVLNLFSKNPHQNANYNPFNLVNSYGAFPEVKNSHQELVLEGKKNGEWEEYDLNYTLDSPQNRPAQIAPYHYMLEYMIDFYLQGKVETDEWLDNLMKKLLRNEEEALKLLKSSPFEESPEKIRAKLYKYYFTDRERIKDENNYWKRELIEILKEKEVS